MQQFQDTSVHYIHDRKESFLSKVIKFFLVMSGWKKGMEKDMVRDSMKQEPSSIPGTISGRQHIETEDFLGRKVWTVRPKRDVSGYFCFNENLVSRFCLFFAASGYIYAE